MGDGEIDDPHLSRAVDQNILRLNVAMNPAAGMHISQARHGLLENVMNFFLQKCRLFSHDAQF